MDKNQGLTLTLPQSLNHLISQSPCTQRPLGELWCWECPSWRLGMDVPPRML